MWGRNFRFGPERGWVVSTSRRPPAQKPDVSVPHALRLVFDPAALPTKMRIAVCGVGGSSPLGTGMARTGDMIDLPVVLLVDDNASVRQSLIRALSFENFGVVAAANGGEALRGLGGNAIDVVLLDQDLGRESGWDTLAQLRQMQPGLPVIIMSARPERGPEHAIERVDALMEKPLDLPLLFQILGALAAQSHAKRLAAVPRSQRPNPVAVV